MVWRSLDRAVRGDARPDGVARPTGCRWCGDEMDGSADRQARSPAGLGRARLSGWPARRGWRPWRRSSAALEAGTRATVAGHVRSAASAPSCALLVRRVRFSCSRDAIGARQRISAIMDRRDSQARPRSEDERHMSKIWYCPNCGYEVTSRGRCHLVPASAWSRRLCQSWPPRRTTTRSATASRLGGPGAGPADRTAQRPGDPAPLRGRRTGRGGRG